MPNTAAEAITALKKNATEEVRVRWSDFHGGRYLDARVFATDGAEPVPTKKGLCLSPDLWRELLPMIEAALETM